MREYMFNGYCPILEKGIAEGHCVDITYELSGIMKEDEIKFIRKYLRKGITNEELYEICCKCPNSSPEFRDYEGENAK